MILLSISGLFRTVLIILGVLFLLQIIGKMMQARRNIAAEDQMKREEAAAQRLKSESKKNFGKTTISKPDSNSIKGEFTDYEEVEE